MAAKNNNRTKTTQKSATQKPRRQPEKIIGLIALVVILVLSASMSTLSSLVIASSSTLTIDFVKGTFMKKMNQKQQLISIRIFMIRLYKKRFTL